MGSFRAVISVECAGYDVVLSLMRGYGGRVLRLSACDSSRLVGVRWFSINTQSLFCRGLCYTLL